MCGIPAKAPTPSGAPRVPWPAFLPWTGALLIACLAFAHAGSYFNNYDDWMVLSEWAGATPAARWALLLKRLSEHVAIPGRLSLGLLYDAFRLWHPPYLAAGLLLHATNGLLVGLVLRSVGLGRLAAALAAGCFAAGSMCAESVLLTIELGFLLAVGLHAGAFLALHAWITGRRPARLVLCAALASLACLGFPARALTPVALLLWILLCRRQLTRRELAHGLAALSAPVAVIVLAYALSASEPMDWAHPASAADLGGVLYRVHFGIARGLVRQALGVKLQKALCEAAFVALAGLAIVRLRDMQRRLAILGVAMIVLLYGIVAAGRSAFAAGNMAAGRYAYLPWFYLVLIVSMTARDLLGRLDGRRRRAALTAAAVVLGAWTARQIAECRAYVAGLSETEHEMASTVRACGEVVRQKLRAGRSDICQTWLCSANLRYFLPVAEVLPFFHGAGILRVVPATPAAAAEVLARGRTDAAWRAAYGLEGALPYLMAVKADAEKGRAVFDAPWPNRSGLDVRLSEIARAWVGGADAWTWTGGPSGLVMRQLWPARRWLGPRRLSGPPADLLPWPPVQPLRSIRLGGAHPSVPVSWSGPGPARLCLQARLRGCTLVTLHWRLPTRKDVPRWLAFRPEPGAEPQTWLLDLTACPDFHGQPIESLRILFTGVPVEGEIVGLWASAEGE